MTQRNSFFFWSNRRREEQVYSLPLNSKSEAVTPCKAPKPMYFKEVA